MSEWIDVRDRMPEQGLTKNTNIKRITVLVCSSGDSSSVRVENRVWDYNLNNPWGWSWENPRGITHWMPKPRAEGTAWSKEKK